MPRIEKFFANQNVKDWTGKSLGGGGGEAFAVDPTSGNTTTTYTGYESREFTSTGTFTVTAGAGVVDILVVGGGGGGEGMNIGNYYFSPGGFGSLGGGGGGGGGAEEVVGMAVSSTGGPAGDGVYPVVIGAGGTGAGAQTDCTPGQPSGLFGTMGGTSKFNGISVIGGGGGRYRGFISPANPYTNPSFHPGQRNNSVGYNGGGRGGSGYPTEWAYGAPGVGGNRYGGGDTGNSGRDGGGGGGMGGQGGIGFYQAPGTWPTSTPLYPIVSPVVGPSWPSGAGPSAIFISVAGKGAAGVNSYFKGGPSAPVYYGGGGGGGMGGEGGNRPGPAGYGYYHWNGPTLSPGGGGQGGAANWPSLPGPNQGNTQPLPTSAGAGTANSGGGGGGGSANSGIPSPNLLNPYPGATGGGNGGSGVVVVRWAV